VKLFHIDTDVLVWGCSHGGRERQRLLQILEAGAPVAMSACAWYEFRRGPRTPDQLATAALLLGESGIVPISADIADEAGDVFRALGSPRRRAADILIGVTARVCRATLLSRNASDFEGIPDLEIEALAPTA
jgi:predicted nucleic acid-binding protein